MFPKKEQRTNFSFKNADVFWNLSCDLLEFSSRWGTRGPSFLHPSALQVEGSAHGTGGQQQAGFIEDIMILGRPQRPSPHRYVYHVPESLSHQNDPA